MPDKTFYTEADLPLATEDRVVEVELEHGVKVQRRVFAGSRVPPDLIDAYNDAGGDAAADTEAAPASDTAVDYDAMSPEDLEKLVDDRGLDVTGTGANGNVLKKDRVAALQAADAA